VLTTDEKDGLEKCDGSVTKEISARKGKEAPSADREGKKRIASPEQRTKQNERVLGRTGATRERNMANTGMFSYTQNGMWKEITTHIMACSGGDCTGSWEGVTSTTGSMSSEITDIVLGSGD